jgi:hypothetical protein
VSSDRLKTWWNVFRDGAAESLAKVEPSGLTFIWKEKAGPFEHDWLQWHLQRSLTQDAGTIEREREMICLEHRRYFAGIST